MIAVALGLISVVVMITTGVMVSSSGADHLTFLGVGVETTTAQVFVTGAIFAWLFVTALWLLRVGMQRSGARCAELSGRWAGFGFRGRADLSEDRYVYQAAGPGRTGPLRLARVDLSRFGPGWAEGTRPGSGTGEVGGAASIGTGPGRIADGAGPADDDGVAPRRPDPGAHLADPAPAPARHQRRPVTLHRTLGAGAAVVPAAAALGIRVRRCGQGSEVGGHAGAVPREDGRPDGQHGQSADRQ